MNAAVLANPNLQIAPAQGTLHRIEGTLQRVNYPRRELTVIANGEIYYFTAGTDTQLRFDDQPAILRCFHPLDQVRVEFEPGEETNRLVAMSAWERR